MSDIVLWLMSDVAEVFAADARAPEFAILDSSTRAQFQDAVSAGISLLQTRCHLEISPDGADVLSLFPGEWDDPDNAYTAITQGPANAHRPRRKSWHRLGQLSCLLVFHHLSLSL